MHHHQALRKRHLAVSVDRVCDGVSDLLIRSDERTGIGANLKHVLHAAQLGWRGLDAEAERAAL